MNRVATLHYQSGTRALIRREMQVPKQNVIYFSLSTEIPMVIESGTSAPACDLTLQYRTKMQGGTNLAPFTKKLMFFLYSN